LVGSYGGGVNLVDIRQGLVQDQGVVLADVISSFIILVKV
jgi:hypothetical protein